MWCKYRCTDHYFSDHCSTITFSSDTFGQRTSLAWMCREVQRGAGRCMDVQGGAGSGKGEDCQSLHCSSRTRPLVAKLLCGVRKLKLIAPVGNRRGAARQGGSSAIYQPALWGPHAAATATAIRLRNCAPVIWYELVALRFSFLASWRQKNMNNNSLEIFSKGKMIGFGIKGSVNFEKSLKTLRMSRFITFMLCHLMVALCSVACSARAG